MNKFVKGTFIFTGGVAGGLILCGITTIKLVVKSNTFRTVVKDKIADEVTTFLYGEQRKRGSYTDIYGHEYRKEQRKQIDIIVGTRKEAEDILSYINDIFEDYGSVSVADLYDLCGLTSRFKDNQIGWKDPDSMAKMYIVRTRQGYQLKLPKPVELA